MWFLPEFVPEFMPGPELSASILFLDELTAADQRLQTSAHSLILESNVGDHQLPACLPAGWLAGGRRR